MKYKVGDRVKIRADLKGDKYYTTERGLNLFCALDMTEYRGQIYTIKGTSRDRNTYSLSCDAKWVWCAEMFESLQEENEL